jgi:hypothetical protein
LAALIQFVQFFLNSGISRNSPISFTEKKKHEKFDRNEIHSSRTRPESSAALATEEEKTDQRSQTKFNLREFLHLLSSR